MTIKLKRAYEAPKPSDGRRFLVDRVWPRGVRKSDLDLEAWLRDVGPSSELRVWFGHDPELWEEFQRRYRSELASRPDVLAPLFEAVRHGDITLVYGARDEQHNQAQVIKTWLEEHV